MMEVADMSVWNRVVRYLILWGALFVLLCIISVIRYWDELVAVVSGTFMGYLQTVLYLGLLIGIFVWGFRMLFRSIL